MIFYIIITVIVLLFVVPPFAIGAAVILANYQYTAKVRTYQYLDEIPKRKRHKFRAVVGLTCSSDMVVKIRSDNSDDSHYIYDNDIHQRILLTRDISKAYVFHDKADAREMVTIVNKALHY